MILLALVTNQHRQNEVVYYCMQSSEILVSSAEFLRSPLGTGDLSDRSHPWLLHWYCL